MGEAVGGVPKAVKRIGAVDEGPHYLARCALSMFQSFGETGHVYSTTEQYFAGCLTSS